MVVRRHVPPIDPDPARRAKFAVEVCSRAIHAEVDESVEELPDRGPTHGSLPIVDQEPGDPKQALQEVRSQARHLPPALNSEHPSPHQIVNAMLSGVIDYLESPLSPEMVDRSVERLQRQSEQMARLARRKAEARKLVTALTQREHDVLEGLLAGQSNKVMAKELGLSLQTVEIQRANMLNRLNARSTSDAVRIAIYAGLAEQPGTG
jgi:two-component system response regulator FixJ